MEWRRLIGEAERPSLCVSRLYVLIRRFFKRQYLFGVKFLIALLLLVGAAVPNSAEPHSESIKPGPAVPLEQLIEMLKNEDRGTRSRAAYYIGEQGIAAAVAVPALIEQIKPDEPEFLISSALSALGKVGERHEQTIPTLFKAFNQHPSGSRWYAAEGLVHIGDASIPTLLAGTRSEIVSEEMWSQVCMAQILGFDSVHFQFVLDAFSSDDRTRSAIALRGLAMIEHGLPAETLPRLLAALERPAEDGFRRTEILAIIGAMRKKATPAVPRIIPLLEDPEFIVRLRVVQALGKIGGSPAAPAVPALIRLLDSGRDFSSRNAVASLGENGGSEVFPVVPGGIRILNGERDVLPQYIVKTLGKIGGAATAAVPKLIEIMHYDLDNELGGDAAFSLLEIAANSPKLHQGFTNAMKKHGATENFVAQYFAQNVPITPEWIDVFLELFEQGNLPQRLLRILFFRVSPEDQKRFPIQFDRFKYN